LAKHNLQQFPILVAIFFQLSIERAVRTRIGLAIDRRGSQRKISRVVTFPSRVKLCLPRDLPLYVDPPPA
jgi:hypothetical protein